MAKNKDINISPSKGINIVIKNDIQQPPIKTKKKRKYKKKVNKNLLKCQLYLHIFHRVMFHISNHNMQTHH